MRPPWKVILILAAVWIVAICVVLLSRSLQPTPASFEKYLARHDLNQASDAERAKIIERAADQLNRLSWDQRQQISRDKKDREFVRTMTPDERTHFMDLTLPEGFHQMVLAFNKMDPEKRQKIVQSALENIRKANPPADPHFDDAQAQQIVSKGLESFYKDSSPEVKLDFAPVIEEIQKSTENYRQPR